jgi:hypothetical protein
MGTTGCPETSVQNYHSTLRNIPEGCISNPCTTFSVAGEINLYSVIEIPVTREEVPLKYTSKRITNYSVTEFARKWCDVNEIISPH